MNIAIIGAGAIGGVLAVRLARAGHRVALVARGDHLAAIRARGLTLLHRDAAATVACAAADDPGAFGPQDVVFITLKAPAIGPMLARLKPLLGADTVVVPAINGLPWWYFAREGGRFDGSAIACLDPDGAMLRAIDPRRILGCVVHAAAEMPEPGTVRLTSADAPLILGELDNTGSARLAKLAEALQAAGLPTTVSTQIRTDIWTKLMGNLPFNPLGALTGLSMDRILAEDRLVALVRVLMEETLAVGAAYGIAFPVGVEQRIAIARKLGPIKASMLQDVELGRPLEVEAILGAAIELARRVGVPTPAMEPIYALLLGRDAALRGASAAEPPALRAAN